MQPVHCMHVQQPLAKLLCDVDPNSQGDASRLEGRKQRGWWALDPLRSFKRETKSPRWLVDEVAQTWGHAKLDRLLLTSEQAYEQLHTGQIVP